MKKSFYHPTPFRPSCALVPLATARGSVTDCKERHVPPTISMNMELFTRSWEKLCDAGYESERDFSATD